MNPIKKADLEQLKKLARDLQLSADIKRAEKIIASEKVFKELAKALSSAEAGIVLVSKTMLQNNEEEIAESDDPGQYIYELGVGAHFDVDEPDAFEFTEDGYDVIIELGGMSDTMEYVKLSDLIKDLENGEWLVYDGDPEPVNSKPLIQKLKGIKDSLI